jgi:mono/diheme cytochrome c family protein
MGIASAAVAQEVPASRVVYGQIFFELACAVCHGFEGRGDGIFGRTDDVPAPDLTGLTLRNNGVFPAERIAHVIDGRETAPAHGGQMPAWGQLYARALEQTAPDTDYEQLVRQRIGELVEYIRTIQR